MNMKTFKKIGTSLICALFAMPLMAQQTYEEMEQLTVNEQVTTVITASEPIRFVDISTDMVVGDQPINNTIRLKPLDLTLQNWMGKSARQRVRLPCFSHR